MIKYLLILNITLAFLSGCGGQDQQNQVDPGQPFSLSEPYMRATGNKLEMSVKSFVPANGSGPKVTLIGMIHIGDPSYYKQVQERINATSYVLWEGIGGAPGGDPYLVKAMFTPSCGTLMEFVNHGNTADQLSLVSQKLTYPQSMAIWADLGVEPLLDQFLATQFSKDRRHEMPNNWNDSKCYQVLWLFNEGLKLKPSGINIDLMGEPEQVRRQIRNLQRTTAFTRKAIIDSLHSDTEPFPGFREVLIDRRNDVVLEKLALVLPYTSSEILIVYGAAHMADIEKRFTRTHSYVPHRERRLTAFSY